MTASRHPYAASFVLAAALLACDGRTDAGSAGAAAPQPADPPTRAVPQPPEPVAPASVPEDAAPPAPAGRDFVDQARVLMRVVACAGDAPVPPRLRARHIAAHCKRTERTLKNYRERWLARARPFFAELVPDDVPATVVYPFGGGDLLTALTVYPDLREVTTISLEPAGDPRGIDELPRGAVEAQLDRVRAEITALIYANHNKTANMIEFMRGGKLPGHLAFSLTALAVHGLQPVSVRYFELTDDGTIRYVTAEDIARSEASSWKARNQFFSNVEITFSESGAPDDARVFRHIRANLDDEHLAADGRLLAHLRAKGKVAAMTKAASFLLWWSSFSTIREYLLDHMTWMVSDATGIPPAMAREAGFEQVTWGKFEGPILKPDRHMATHFIALWARNPHQSLPFRFGYPDKRGHDHLMVTRRAE